MATFFCPSCWGEISPILEKCPLCGFILARYDQLTFEEKLLGSLHHPVFERRVMAARILGFLKSHRALAPFKEILSADNTDYYFARAILEAIDQIDHPESRLILEKATSHLIELIRELARELINRKREPDVRG